MHFALLLLFGSLLTHCAFGNVVQGTINLDKLKKIFEQNVNSKDLSSLYYSTRGLNLLKSKINNPTICEDLKNTKVEITDIEQVFYLVNGAVYTGCQNSLKPEVLKAATQVLDKKDATISEIYYAIFTMKALGKGTVYDKETGWKNLLQLLKKDDSALNYAFMFELCDHLGCGAWVTQHGDSVLAQADELDGRMLQWEGGLPVTSALLRSILGSYKALNKPSPLTVSQGYKFAEYLLSRRSVTTARGACLLLEAAVALSDDTKAAPISITIKGKKYITWEADSVDVEITDLLGRPVKLSPEEVVAQSGTRLADDVVVLSKQPLTPKPNQPSVYTLNLGKLKSQYGLYKIALSAGSRTTSLTVGVLGDMSVASADIGVGDIDGTTTPKTTTVNHPNILAEKIQADHLQKLFVKFTVRDKSNKAMQVQQAFVRISNAETQEEVIFVAEPDSTKTYKVDLNVGAISKHFNHQSGVYAVDLYIGDSAASQPINWRLAHVAFKFSEERAAPKLVSRAARPEITHLFRSAEPRPPRAVSDVFAAACAAPLLLLLLLWARLGLNLSNFPFTLSALFFHTGLGAIFGLFVVFWLQLNMFDTIRYLLGLGFITFISGHRLFRHLVQSKKNA